MTLPDEPRTLPNRTPQNLVVTSSEWPHDSTIHSHSAFDCPMTVFAFTALSVETRTNRFAPKSTAMSATVRVTSVLLRTASSGFASISGTCLYAAAWKTTAGPVLLEDLAHLGRVPGVGEDGGGRVELALVHELALDLEETRLTVVHEHQPRRPHARDLAAQLRPDRAAGARDEHDLAGEVAGDRGRSTSTGSRPRRSSTSTGLIWPARLKSPAMSSGSPGSVFTGTPAARATSTMRSRTSPDADGIAMSSSSGRLSRSSSGSSAVVPSTRTPCSRRFFLRGSSSTSPIGV